VDPRSRAAPMGRDPDNLGNALSVLGERTNGAAELEQAIAAYRDALKELTRERVPLEWATTQINLGCASGPRAR
jgi:hypothetical protein